MRLLSIREAGALGEAYGWAAEADRSKYLWSFSFPTGTMPRMRKSSAVVKIASKLRCIRMPGGLALIGPTQTLRGYYAPRAFKSVHLMILHMCIFKLYMVPLDDCASVRPRLPLGRSVSHRFGHRGGFRDSVSLPCFRTFRLPPVETTFWCRSG